MSRPLYFAGAIPEVDSVSGVFVEIGFNLGSKQYNNILEGVDLGL